MNLSSRVLLSSISIISCKKLPPPFARKGREREKERKFHYRSALSIYTPFPTIHARAVVAHSSLVTVTIDSLTRSRPLIRDAIDSREGGNRIEGVRIPRMRRKLSPSFI